MKRLLNFITILTLGALTQNVCIAHPDDAITFYAGKMTVPPVMDGVIGATEYTSVTKTFVSYVETPNPNNPDFGFGSNPGFILPNKDYHKGWNNTDADMSLDMYIGYTDTDLIMAFRVYDDILDIQEVDSSSPWENDSLEIFINPDLDDEDFTPAHRDSTLEGFQFIIDAAGNDLVGGRNLDPPFPTIGTSTLNDGYVIELSLPLNQLQTQSGAANVVPPTTGSVLRWTLGHTDNDRDLDDNQDVYAVLWRAEGDGSPFGQGEPGWHSKIVLGSNPIDLNGDGAIDAADAGIMFGDWGGPGSTSPADFNKDGFVDAADAGTMFEAWTGDPGTPAAKAATAEYNPETGELKISSAGAVNVFVQSASNAITPVNPAPVVPIGLLTNNTGRVGITNLGPIEVTNFSFGNIGKGLAMSDPKLVYTTALGTKGIEVPASADGNATFKYIPEPAGFGLAGLGLAAMLAGRRRA